MRPPSRSMQVPGRCHARPACSGHMLASVRRPLCSWRYFAQLARTTQQTQTTHSSCAAVVQPMSSSPQQDESWDHLLDILSGLITFKTRADGKGWRDAFENMPVYLQRAGLQEDIQRLSVIHVAGTKGKGSTCAMLDSVLRSCGYRVGLFTSPHLCDVRERVRVNGHMVSREVFGRHFWDCYNSLEAAVTDDVGMPGYFRFLTLLGLKVFCSQPLDAVILEVGIGGRLDATNIIRKPVVTAVTSLGFDHMELLGDTLPKIAREKAGILRQGVPAYSVQQPADAMEALQECADAAGAPLTVPPPLSSYTPEGGAELRLGIAGEHQQLNASLAVQLAAAWEAGNPAAAATPGAQRRLGLLKQGVLPAEYMAGLAAARWPGRSQVIPDPDFQGLAATGHTPPDSRSGSGSSSRLVFYLDGAHTPESMVTCGDWFAAAASPVASGSSSSSAAVSSQQQQQQQQQQQSGAAAGRRRVLVFNCMKERDPAVLLPQLRATLQQHGVHIDAAVFVPPDSQYSSLTKTSSSGSGDGNQQQQQQQAPARDLSWQQHQQQIWAGAGPGGQGKDEGSVVLHAGLPLEAAAAGVVGTSVGATLEWLRSCCRQQPALQLEVLITGSLYLVGDVLRTLGNEPE